ncbi:MAG: hypothetical protein H6706_28075 [Myxococcales bacterium]|nr:hypothetical protein [Myxococcales bacterium]
MSILRRASRPRPPRRPRRTAAPAAPRGSRKASRARNLAPVPPLAAEPGAGDLDAFLAALPERSRAFLLLVRERGVLGIDEAMERLDIQAGKAVGGLTGSIARWAPVHGVEVPFTAIQGIDGKRAWRWTGEGA